VNNNRLGLWGEGVYRVLVGKPEGKEPLWRPRPKCVDNSRLDLWEEEVFKGLVRKPEGRDNCGDLGVDGWIILGRICGGGRCIVASWETEGKETTGET
jgi:hypothetical protein